MFHFFKEEDQKTNGSRYSRVDQVKFVEDSLKILKVCDMVLDSNNVLHFRKKSALIYLVRAVIINKVVYFSRS